MKKKGFTLIELLAVIIILAVIALIATPVILNVVENARRSAFQQSANGYYDAARYLYDELYLNRDRQDLTFTFEDGVQTSSNEKYQLKVKGETPKGGLVYLSKDGQIMVSIHNNRYCATTDGTGKVSLSEDIENCVQTITNIPESCYSIRNEQLYDYIKSFSDLDGSEEWMTKTYNTLYYSKRIEGCPSDIDTLIIPSEIDGQKVEAIKFYEVPVDRPNSIKHIIIPTGVKVLSYNAFGNRKVSSIILPNSLIYIGRNSLAGNELTNIVIPDSVKIIGSTSFGDNQLTNLEIADSVTSIGNAAFSGNQLTSVTIPNSVTSIGGNAFIQNQLTNITIPNSVTRIEDSTFQNNQLTSVEIPDSVTYIGSLAFFGNQLTSLEIPNSVTGMGSMVFNNNQLPDDQAFIYKRNSDGSIDNTTLISYGGARREDVVIPGNVITIIGSAFQLLSPLTGNMIIPDSVTTFEGSLFSGSKFNTLTIGSGITTINRDILGAEIENLVIGNHNGNVTIASDAFKNRTLQSLVIGKGVNSIENNAFTGATIKQLTIDSKTTEINGSVFNGSTIDKAIIGTNTEGNIIVQGFSGLKLKELVLGNSVTSIENGAFNSNQLTNIEIPNSVTSIGLEAFNNNQLPDDQAFIYKRNNDGSIDTTYLVSYGGAKKENVVTPAGIEIIGEYSLISGIKSLTISEGVKRIENYACAWDYTLERLTLPNSLEYIGEEAFESQLLNSIIIPASVITIKDLAFDDNPFDNASNIIIEGDATRFDSSWTSIGFPAK